MSINKIILFLIIVQSIIISTGFKLLYYNHQWIHCNRMREKDIKFTKLCKDYNTHCESFILYLICGNTI